MKKLCIALIVCLIISLLTVAFADIILHSTRMQCLSQSCGRAHTIHNCLRETRSDPVQVECPDQIVNCNCQMIVIRHEYQCEMCEMTRIIPVTVYHHSK